MPRLYKMTKIKCTRCDETDRDKFPIEKRRVNSIGSWCCQCLNAHNRTMANTPEGREKANMRRKRLRARRRIEKIFEIVASGHGVRLTKQLKVEAL